MSEERHGPACKTCEGKGWMNTADQNRAENYAQLVAVAKAAKVLIERIDTANLAESKLVSVQAEYGDGDSHSLNPQIVALRAALSAAEA